MHVFSWILKGEKVELGDVETLGSWNSCKHQPRFYAKEHATAQKQTSLMA
jgi:hypothetical protein